MTAGGWITMVACLTAVWGGALWCFRRVLAASRAGNPDDPAGPDRS